MKLQILGGCASLIDQGEPEIVSDNSKIILKLVESTIKECETYLNFKLVWKDGNKKLPSNQ